MKRTLPPEVWEHPTLFAGVLQGKERAAPLISTTVQFILKNRRPFLGRLIFPGADF
jgi:hypothetical protein